MTLLVPLPDGSFKAVEEQGETNVLEPPSHYSRGTKTPVSFPITGPVPSDATVTYDDTVLPLQPGRKSLSFIGSETWPIGWVNLTVHATGREWKFRLGVVD